MVGRVLIVELPYVPVSENIMPKEKLSDHNPGGPRRPGRGLGPEPEIKLGLDLELYEPEGTWSNCI